jgi:signal transduction histidine kinase
VSLQARLLTAFGYVVALVVVAFGVPLAANLSERVGNEVRTQSRSQADVLAAGVPTLLDAEDRPRLATLARSVGRAARARVVVVDRRGRVLADSAGAQSLGGAYGARPEIAAALAGRRVQEQRRSDTLDEQILATSAPVFGSGRRVLGAVRLTQSVDAVAAASRRTVGGVVVAGLAVLVAALLVAFLLARGITRPIERLRAATDRIAGGDVDARAAVEGSQEQRSLARSFNAMTERLARALGAQTEFVADASHQLRTPLTGLRLRLEEARHSEDRAGAARHLDAGLGELDRMSQTIEELLLLSRTGEREQPGEEVELADALADARRRWAPTADARGVDLAVAADGGGAVWCARADLDRALDAVLENAILYTPAGGNVRVQAAGGAIEVADDGPGLAPGEEDEVFNRFRRGAAGTAAAPGSGLGLPIARELMRCWGGEARLDNRREGGARATLSLPPGRGAER